jgi:transposase
LDGLKDKPRSGRLPSLVTNDLMIKIRKELEDSNTRWDFRQVMEIIQKRTNIKYHEVYIYRLLHKWGFSAKVPQKKICKNRNSRREKEF